ncbi:uncharacterized protein LOC141915013 isoform X2 [Tubulanus polymorphus]
MPDQHADDILDHVNYVWEGRPVHCYYVSGRTSDPAATKFLQDLASETYGSFHVVSVTTHGCIERVSPIFRSDHSNSKIIRTSRGAIFPDTKACSVSSTLAGDPLMDYLPYPRVHIDDVTCLPIPYYFPYHYYYYHPYYAWSRYRPARAWMKNQEKLQTETGDMGLSPAAGALLINKQVLARRQKDGYYYKGSVKSQIHNDQFLVEFGPCKHGDFIDTEYQETMVYDIISLADALRHAIVPGDKVLAIWQPEGEQYLPGIVIEGMERRDAETGTDQEITVTFFNGKTEKVPLGTGLWIPHQMYERLALELKMPKEARKYLEKTVNYPEESKPGYPTSGSMRDPVNYTFTKPIFYDQGEVMVSHGALGFPRYSPLYPIMRKYTPSSTPKTVNVTNTVKSEDMDNLIPGTELTQSDLNEKILSQLAEHQLRLEEIADGTSKLLKKREQEESNVIKAEPAKEDLEVTQDSKVDSGVEEDDFDINDFCFEDATTQTETLQRPKKKSPTKRPPWKNYWPDYTTQTHLRAPPYHEPYKDSSGPNYIELRKPPTGPYGVEWKDSTFNQAAAYNSRGKCDPDIMYRLMSNVPRPPTTQKDSQPQPPGKDFTSQGCHQDNIDRLEAARREYRRQQVQKRIENHQNKINDDDKLKAMIRDFHRERILEQINREKQRETNEYNAILRAREGKKQINEQIRQRIEENQQWERARLESRESAARLAKERRAAIREQRNRQIHNDLESKKQQYLEHQQGKWANVRNHLEQEIAREHQVEQGKRRAKAQRIHHFRQIERECQREKIYKHTVSEMQNGIWRSEVLP